MVLAVQMTISFTQLQLIDNVADVFVVHVEQVPQVQVVIVMCVSTAPVAEPIVMSFTVPWIGCTIVATANVGTSSSLADCPDCCWSVYVATSCGGGFFTPGAAYDGVWDSVKPMTGNFFKYFQYQEFVECVCILNDCLISNYDICADSYNFSRFKLKDKCRSEQWDVFLYGGMTIKVMMTIFAQTTTTFPGSS